MVIADASLARAWAAARAVPDPEIPALTVEDLGILRDVRIDGGKAIAQVTPTYTGCPAVLAIELAVAAALTDAGFDAKVERVLAPAWTTDWITEQGRAKLIAYGIAPPAKGAGNARSALFADEIVACPRCGSTDTALVSHFGSTPCKSQRRCVTCAEPFDHFKCL